MGTTECIDWILGRAADIDWILCTTACIDWILGRAVVIFSYVDV